MLEIVAGRAGGECQVTGNLSDDEAHLESLYAKPRLETS